MTESEITEIEVGVPGRWREAPARGEHGFKVGDSTYLGTTPGVLRLPRGVMCEWLIEQHLVAEDVNGVASSALATRVSDVTIEGAVVEARSLAALTRLGPALEHVAFHRCTGAPGAAAAGAERSPDVVSELDRAGGLGELPHRLDLLVVHAPRGVLLDSMEVIARARPRAMRLWLPMPPELVARASRSGCAARRSVW